ncbi:hypothetical protein GE061_010133 [Apolygus lucorum]|uniref:Pro-resilin n=1 Tax=Apolygus lucorum TaxID=248454 RepID=A0A8S9Y480_APOLU|nr:hypothetical protein GE061_010133 [Apolygus lucorum]
MRSMIILLSCIGLSAAQTPADTTYLSLVRSSYITSDPRFHGARFAVSSSADEVQLRGPADGLESSANQTVQDVNGFIGTSGVDSNVQTDRQVARGSVRPHSRILIIPPSHQLTPFWPTNKLAYQPDTVETPYNLNVDPSQNDQIQINANSRTNDEPRLNPEYSGPSLFSHSAQAAMVRFPSQPQYQPPQYQQQYQPSQYQQQYQPHNAESSRVDPSLGLRTLEPSNINGGALRSLTGVRNGLSSIDDRTSHTQGPSNQNEYNTQHIARGNLDPISYQFSYDVNAVEKGRPVQFAHEEQRGRDQAAGAYSVLLPDGQRQVVEYTADEDGYRPRVSYDGQRTSGGYPPAESYESPVIAARSQPNGGRRSDAADDRHPLNPGF